MQNNEERKQENADRVVRKENARRLFNYALYSVGPDPSRALAPLDQKIIYPISVPVTFRAFLLAGGTALLAGCAVTGHAIHSTLAMALGQIDWWLSLQAIELRDTIVVVVTATVLIAIAAAFSHHRSRLITVGIVGLACLAILTGSVWVYAGIERDNESKKMADLFAGAKWISYDQPTAQDPKIAPLSLDRMTGQLQYLHDKGHFTGLVTFQFSHNLIKAAESAGFEKIVVGFHVDGPEGFPDGKVHKPQEVIDEIIDFETSNPNNKVIGYCLGHNVSTRVPLDELYEWMAELREHTGKFVTTTFSLSSYLGERGRRVRMTGDWYFPDINAGWQEGCTPELAIERTRRAVDQITELGDKPVMLKMVSYPSGPTPDFNEDKQAKFFKELTRDVYLPHGCQIAIFAAYDIPWKGKRPATQPTTEPANQPFADSERYVGLLDAPEYSDDGKMKVREKKAFEIVSNQWPINVRP